MTSAEWQKLAEERIPGGVNSPVRSFKHVGGAPIFFQKGDGAYLTDVEGKRYVDFCLSFGPHLLGHSHPRVVAALKEQAEQATSFGACHPKEVQLADLILKGYPFLQMVRLVNSGTEAVMTAIRLVRGVTGRSKIIKFEGAYHGHSDALLAKAGSSVAELSESTSKGVPESIVRETIIVKYDDLGALEAAFEEHGNDVAAVLFEAIPANHGLFVPDKKHVANCVDLARRYGALVVFDEVITGFRVGPGGAAAYYGQTPDVVCLGKIIGGGLPLAAVAGTKEIMSFLAPLGPVYQAGTLSGNPLAAAAGIAVLNEVYEKSPYTMLEFSTQAFVSSLTDLLKPWGPFQIRSLASIFWIHFGEERNEFPPEITAEGAATYRKFFRACLDQGIYFAPSPYEVGFLSTAHTPEVLNTVLDKIAKIKP